MELQNLAQLHSFQAQRLGPRPALRYKKHGLYHDCSWERAREEALALASALADAGIRPGDRVALVGENSKDWLIADLGILSAGAVAVTPHAPLTAQQIHYQLLDAEASWAIVSTAAQRDKVLSVRSELPALRGIVVFDASAGSPGVQTWDAFLQKGRRVLSRSRKELSRREEQLGPDDLATVMYTSGTTGNPKGVMLTHNNLLSNAAACIALEPYGPDDVILSWLPYTHIYARTVDHYTTLLAGVTLALAESPESLVENLKEVQPTHLAAVPRFYEKVLASVSTPDASETGRRLRRIFGPRINGMSSGGAPLPLPVARAYLDAGLLLFQGYGLTETSPVISFNTKTHNKPGTVGRPIPGVEVRIAPDGEILTRGPHVMKGYWKNPQATAEVLRDGWFHTGDLGALDSEGFLSVTGRKKELLVLSNGKKVAPSNLEGLLLADPCVDQVMVCGEGRNFLTALVVPHWENLLRALGEEGTHLTGPPEELARSEAVYSFLERRIEEALIGLSRMEQIRKFTVLPRPFSLEAEELTVSLKIRRNAILGHNAERIAELYQSEEDGVCGEPGA